MRELQPSVLDTMAIWYLSIIGSTAKVAMPVAPQLRNLILTQSKWVQNVTAESHDVMVCV